MFTTTKRTTKTTTASGAREACARSRRLERNPLYRSPASDGPGLFVAQIFNSMEDKVSNDPVVAIVGVTGAVGAEFIATMDKRDFRVSKLKALASARSAGKTVSFRGQSVVIEELTERSFDGVDIALFSAGGSISKKFAPIAVKAGAVVVDNSSAFRMDPNVPLVIPRSMRTASGITRASSPIRTAPPSPRWCRCGRSIRRTASSA